MKLFMMALVFTIGSGLAQAQVQNQVVKSIIVTATPGPVEFSCSNVDWGTVKAVINGTGYYFTVKLLKASVTKTVPAPGKVGISNIALQFEVTTKTTDTVEPSTKRTVSGSVNPFEFNTGEDPVKLISLAGAPFSGTDALLFDTTVGSFNMTMKVRSPTLKFNGVEIPKTAPADIVCAQH